MEEGEVKQDPDVYIELGKGGRKGVDESGSLQAERSAQGWSVNLLPPRLRQS